MMGTGILMAIANFITFIASSCHAKDLFASLWLWTKASHSFSVVLEGLNCTLKALFLNGQSAKNHWSLGALLYHILDPILTTAIRYKDLWCFRNKNLKQPPMSERKKTTSMGNRSNGVWKKNPGIMLNPTLFLGYQLKMTNAREQKRRYFWR